MKKTITLESLKRFLIESTVEDFKDVLKRAYPWTDWQTRKTIIDLYKAEGETYPDSVEELISDLPELVDARCSPAKARMLLKAVEKPDDYVDDGDDDVKIPEDTVRGYAEAAAGECGVSGTVEVRRYEDAVIVSVGGDDEDREKIADVMAQNMGRKGHDVDVWVEDGEIHVLQN